MPEHATQQLQSSSSPLATRLQMLLNLEIAAASTLVIVWTVFPHGLWYHLGIVAFAWPILAHSLRSRRLPATAGTSPKATARSREVSEGIRTFALAVPLLIYVEWSRRAGVQPLVALGSVLFILGTLITFSSLWTFTERPLVGWGLALACAGLAVPKAMPHSGVSADAMIGAAGIVGGLWAWVMYSTRLARMQRAAQQGDEADEAR